MTENQISNLITINNSLNTLNVQGKQNCTIIVGCMNIIQDMLKDENVIEGGSDANIHAES